MAKLTLLQDMKVVEALPPAADAAGRTGAFVSLKNAGRAFVKVHLAQGNAATVQVSVVQATNVAGANAKPLANAVPVWANQDTGAGDAFVRQPDAVSFTTSAAVKGKHVLLQIDPALLDVNAGFDCIAVVTGASNAANVVGAEYLLTDLRYSSATPPSALAN